MRNKKLLRFSVVVGGALVAGAAGVLYPVMVAKSVLSDVPTMTRQAASEAWLRQWAREHGATVECDDSDCAAVVSTSNWLLARLKLAPPTLFSATIALTDRKLAYVRLSLTDLDYQFHEGATTSTIVDYTEVSHPGSGPTARLVQEPVGKPPSVAYFVTPGVAPHELALARDVNVWCLARIGGCLKSQQAPGVWALRKPNKS